MYCSLEDLANESDVEQKFLWPLLTTPHPNGLDYGPADIKTKIDLRRLAIDKGTSSKLYHPDYVIVIAGVPLIVVEAKHPDEDCASALREARLYANELNALFPTGVNPCRRIVVCNGRSLLTSPVDSMTVDCELTFSHCDVTCEKYHAFLSLCARSTAQATADALQAYLTPRPLFRAVNMLGGHSVRDEDIGYNEFGSKLALDYRTIFNPDSRKDRARIVQNAYITSERREHYVDEVDRIIKSAVVSVVPGSKLIEDTSAPKEILSALRAGRKLENEIMLLVGARGSGKTTFVDYCRLVKLPPDLAASTAWVHLNLNEAPKQRSHLEDWALRELADGLRNSRPDIDFDDREVIERVYGVELNKLRKGALAKLTPGTEAYEIRVADAIMALQASPLSTAKAMSRYLCGERNCLLVVVFDNCDKQDRDEQLGCFQIARWLQSEIRCLVILPIRDVTYHACKDRPPLDTTIKDLVFRIDPPPFSKVLGARIRLVLDDLQVKSDAKVLDYTLDNGIRVSYPATELGYYLASIYKSLYEYDRLIRSLLLGLAGRDMRKAMEIFLEFCRSGHIGPVEYLKMKTARGHYSLPYGVVTCVLLRRNRRFYDGNASFVANLFQCVPNDAKPNSFVRFAILQWLRSHFRERGPTGIKGFHRYRDLASDLIPLGHDSLRIKDEVVYLIQHGCIITEHQQLELRTVDDLLLLSPSGFVHLNIVSDPSYLAACSEETWVTSEKMAKEVSNRIGFFGPQVHYSPVTMLLNAKDFIKYLMRRSDTELANPKAYLENVGVDVRQNITHIAGSVQRTIEKFKSDGDWGILDERFAVGMECNGTVTGTQDYGAFVKLDGGPTGLLYFKNLPEERPISSMKRHDRLRVKLLRIEIEAKKLSLGYVRDLEDDE